MKAPSLFAATLLTLGLSTSAFAQTTPTTTPINSPANNRPVDNNTNVLVPSNNTREVRTMQGGASISNNRDVLSPGTGTPAPPARTDAEKRAHRAEKQAKKAAKGK